MSYHSDHQKDGNTNCYHCYKGYYPASSASSMDDNCIWIIVPISTIVYWQASRRIVLSRIVDRNPNYWIRIGDVAYSIRESVCWFPITLWTIPERISRIIKVLSLIICLVWIIGRVVKVLIELLVRVAVVHRIIF